MTKTSCEWREAVISGDWTDYVDDVDPDEEVIWLGIVDSQFLKHFHGYTESEVPLIAFPNRIVEEIGSDRSNELVFQVIAELESMTRQICDAVTHGRGSYFEDNGIPPDDHPSDNVGIEMMVIIWEDDALRVAIAGSHIGDPEHGICFLFSDGQLVNVGEYDVAMIELY